MTKNANDELVILAQMAAEHQGFSWRDLLANYFPLILIVLAGVGLTCGGYIATRLWESEIQSIFLSGQKQIYVDSIRSRLDAQRQRASMLEALYNSSESVNAAELATFSGSLFQEVKSGAFLSLLRVHTSPAGNQVEGQSYSTQTSDLSADVVQSVLESSALKPVLQAEAGKTASGLIELRLGGQTDNHFLVYVNLVRTADPAIRHLIVSGARFQQVMEPPTQDILLQKRIITSNSITPQDPAVPHGQDVAHVQFDESHVSLRYENLRIDFDVAENNDFLRKSSLFRYALVIFSVLFTGLLGVQFLYAKRSVEQLATLAVQRTSDLTSINSELTDEIMNRVRFQAELLQRNTQIEEANKKLADVQEQMIHQEKMASLGQLAAGVAHEINNPIGFINSNLSMLEKYADRIFRLLSLLDESENRLQDAELKDTIATTKQEARYASLRTNVVSVISESREGVERVKRIVQDLKNFSRVDEAEWQWVSLHDGIDSTLNIAWNEIKYKATVHKEYGDLPLVECVPFQINQVIMNLLVNAAQAIVDTGDIHIRTRAEGPNIVIEIEDSGCGIPATIISNIFDPFFTTKEVGKGTGLGLSLSYGIIRKHGGELTVRSVVGQGSTFTIVLPVQQESRRSVA